MVRNRIVTPRRSGSRSRTEWARTDAASGGTAFKALAGGAAVLDQSIVTDDPITLIRTRGMIVVQSDQQAGDENPFGAFGICVVSAQAFAIGITAIPTPYTDADSDLWFVHGYFAAPLAFADATGFANVSQRVDFDSKAMRRMSPDEVGVAVIENGTAAEGLSYTFNFAILAKEG